MSDAIVLVVSSLAWPVAILIITIVVLTSQRKPIGGLIERVKSLKTPIGEAQIEVLPANDGDKMLTLVDAFSRNPGEGLAQPEGTRPSSTRKPADPTENREPLTELEPLPDEKVADLVMLRTKVANLLSDLAVPIPPGGLGSVSATIDTLRNRGVLDERQAQALLNVVGIADQAAAGAVVVPKKVALAAENSGPAILRQLALLRNIAAAQFEDYVLETLRNDLLSGWSMSTDVAIGKDRADNQSALLTTNSSISTIRARVDALVRNGDRSAVVEIRARLQPGARTQIAALQDWLAVLPSDLPILLVVLGDGLTSRELQHLTMNRGGTVEMLRWDREAASLITTLHELLIHSAR